MTILTIPNILTYSFGAILCAYIAKKKGFHTRIALFSGLFFGIFATIYYAFKKPKKKGWTMKDSWTYIGIHLGVIIGRIIGAWIS